MIAKTISKRNENKAEDLDDEKPAQRISSRSKKIKKLGEEFDTSDWKKGQPLKKTQNLENKKVTAVQRTNHSMINNNPSLIILGRTRRGRNTDGLKENYSAIPLEGEN